MDTVGADEHVKRLRRAVVERNGDGPRVLLYGHERATKPHLYATGNSLIQRFLQREVA
jgi:hypothetical protein